MMFSVHGACLLCYGNIASDSLYKVILYGNGQSSLLLMEGDPLYIVPGKRTRKHVYPSYFAGFQIMKIGMVQVTSQVTAPL